MMLREISHVTACFDASGEITCLCRVSSCLLTGQIVHHRLKQQSGRCVIKKLERPRNYPSDKTAESLEQLLVPSSRQNYLVSLMWFPSLSLEYGFFLLSAGMRWVLFFLRVSHTPEKPRFEISSTYSLWSLEIILDFCLFSIASVRRSWKEREASRWAGVCQRELRGSSVQANSAHLECMRPWAMQ